MIEIKLEVKDGQLNRAVNVQTSNYKDVLATVLCLEDTLEEVKKLIKKEILKDDEDETK